MGGCIVYSAIRLLLLICIFLSSFFFLSNFQTLKIFFTLLSETVRPPKSRFGTHMSNGWVYRVYWNQAAAAYLSLYFASFLSLQFSIIKTFSSLFSQELWCLYSWNLVHTWTMGGCIMYNRNKMLLLIHYFISSFFLSLQFSNIKMFVTHFSGAVRPTKLELRTCVDKGWMCIKESSCYCLFIVLFVHVFFLSNLKKNVFFLR